MSIKRIRDLTSEKALFIVTAAIMLLVPVSEVITDILCNFYKVMVPSMFQTVIVELFGIVATVLVLLSKGSELKDKEAGKRWYPADIVFLALTFFMILSAVFSVNHGVFNSGNVFVCEKPFHFMAYFSLFYFGTRITSSECRKKLVTVFLAIALLQGAIAFFQTFNIEIAYCLPIRHDRAAYGLTQNSNYFGGLSVFLLAGCSGAYIFSDKLSGSKVYRFLLPALSGLVFYVMMGSRARLAWIGFAAMMAFYVISGLVMLKGNIDKAGLKRFFIRLAVITAVFAVVFTVTHLCTNFFEEELQRTQWEIEGKLDNGIGSDRLLNWRYGLESIPRHWPTGIGLDNYIQVFYENPKYVPGSYINSRAHNEYLHVLVTQGVFAFTAYLLMYLRTAVISVKRIFKGGEEASQALDWIFLAMFVAYAVQAFFNCSVVNVSMYVWLVLGLLNPCDRPLNLSFKRK